MVSFLNGVSFWELMVISVGVNILLYLFSVVIYILLEKISSNELIQAEPQPITSHDLVTSLLVIATNSLVFLIAVQLWKYGLINIDEKNTWIGCVVEIVALIISLDFLMYVFHKVAHLPVFYKLLHGKHHEHHATNAISLFVMHPLEAFGFGLMMLFVMSLYRFSTGAITIYIFINLVWGTIGHLNKEILPLRWAAIFKSSWLGTTLFHNRHHQTPGYNFGFYTTLWDRLFGTIKMD